MLCELRFSPRGRRPHRAGAVARLPAPGGRSRLLLTALGACFVVACSAIGSSPATACTTPVYRYAMYNWAGAPFYVFHFCHGEPSGEDKALNEKVAGLYDADPPVNITLEEVDVTDQQQLERLPGIVRMTWQAEADGIAPAYVVFTPWGARLITGRIVAEELAAMVDSPARQRLGKLLHEGNAVVLLILTGPDEQKNRQSEKAAAEVLAKAAAGEIPVTAPGYAYMPEEFLPQSPDDEQPQDDAQEETPEEFKVAMMKVSRSDPAERWLVEMLLAVEPDLYEFPEEPMVFAVYGRGRAMPPYVGKGITPENLIDCVVFLGSACSCLVKEQNPGMDLLMQWDWEATADAMAARDPQMAGGPFGYQEYLPVEADTVAETPAAETGVSSPGAPGAEAPDASAGNDATQQGVVESVSEKTTAVAGAEPPSAQRPRAAEAAKRPEARPRVATANGTDQPEKPFAVRQAWKIGIGLALATVAVLIAGTVLVRRRGSL